MQEQGFRPAPPSEPDVRQSEVPGLLEPAVMIDASASAFQTAPFSQDGTQSHAYPPVDLSQLAGFGLFEAAEPVWQCLIEVRHDGFHALDIVTLFRRFRGLMVSRSLRKLLERNPSLCLAKRLSKIGLMTIPIAACTSRSVTVGMPNGRF
jgi:hypothetical protein